jgi:hypothetical protein
MHVGQDGGYDEKDVRAKKSKRGRTFFFDV